MSCQDAIKETVNLQIAFANVSSCVMRCLVIKLTCSHYSLNGQSASVNSVITPTHALRHNADKYVDARKVR